MELQKRNLSKYQSHYFKRHRLLAQSWPWFIRWILCRFLITEPAAKWGQFTEEAPGNLIASSLLSSCYCWQLAWESKPGMQSVLPGYERWARNVTQGQWQHRGWCWAMGDWARLKSLSCFKSCWPFVVCLKISASFFRMSIFSCMVFVPINRNVIQIFAGNCRCFLLFFWIPNLSVKMGKTKRCALTPRASGYISMYLYLLRRFPLWTTTKIVFFQREQSMWTVAKMKAC